LHPMACGDHDRCNFLLIAFAKTPARRIARHETLYPRTPMKLRLNQFVNARRWLMLAAAGLAGVACATFVSAQTPAAKGTSAVAKAARPAAATERHCAQCGSASETCSVCDKCMAKLTAAAAKDGTIMVGTGDKKMMMAISDMMRPESSFVYTLDNDPQRNSVAVYRRGNDGSLLPLVGSPFNAGGRGLMGGDIDEQGAIRSAGNFILAVNPGSDTVAVLEKTSRGLLHVEGSPFPSGGSTPLSLAVHGDRVYVANQAAEFASPEHAPNIAGFKLMKNGKLMPMPGATAELPKGMGPAQVEFAADGRVLVATAGFQADGGEGSRIYTYQVMPDGKLMPGEGSPLKPEGATGTVGFSLSPARDMAFVSTFKGSGVTAFSIDPATAAIKQMGMPVSNDQRAACWTTLTRDGKTLYVGNFVSNSISVYSVAEGGKLNLLGSIPRRGATNKDTKDIALSPNGDFLYAVGSGERQISVFKVEANHLLTELPAGQSPITLPTGQNITGLLVD
jgi:6-phosphogluconolactonase